MALLMEKVVLMVKRFSFSLKMQSAFRNFLVRNSRERLALAYA